MKENKVIALILALVSVFLTGCFSDSSNKSSNPVAPSVGEYQRGIASWYGSDYDGKMTASGEIFDKTKLTAAHRTLAFGTYVEVTDLENGRRIVVKINDRGPFVAGRIIDLSERAAEELGMKSAGTAQVSLKIVNNP